jgi:two-component system chemotaxis response regulator CheY
MTRTILVVDASATVRRILKQALRSRGYRVTAAQGADEALRMARAETFDAVITDYDRPQVDGIALIRRLRVLQCYARAPLMILTAERCSVARELARDAGATAWMAKPLDPHALLCAFARLFSVAGGGA